MIKYIRIVGAIITTLALGLSVAWFGWKLALIIFLATLGNNFEQSED